MVASLSQFSSNGWQEVYKKVNKAVVFIDSICAECLHWHGGIMELLYSGAVVVKEFSSFESGSEKDRKAVFITCGPVVGARRDILKDLIVNSRFEYCVLIMACSPLVQKMAQEELCGVSVGDMTAFHQLESDMLSWMGNKEYTVEILNFPLFLIPITHTVFVMPTFRNLFPFFKEDVMEINNMYGSKKQVELEDLSKEQRIWIHQLKSNLHSLLTYLDMREDIYCLGDLSNIVASQLEDYNIAVTRRKTATQKASLIIIDRNLDLGSVASFSSESIIDRIRTVLPRLPEHSNDVAIDMTPFCAGRIGSVAPGCLAHKGPVLEWLFSMKQKDLLLNLYQELQNQSKTPTKRLLRITSQVLDKQVHSTFTGNNELIAKNCGFIQQISGVTQALKSAKNEEVELAMSIEKLLLQTMAADNGTSGALNQICKLLRCRHERGLDLDTLLSILVHLYSIVGSQFNFSADDEAILQSEISKAIYADRNSMEKSALNMKVGPESTVEEVDNISLQIMTKLQNVASTRNHFVKYRNVLKNEGPLQPLVYNSLIEQLLDDLLDANKPIIPDLINKSEGLFKSGFSKLLSSSRHPLDNQNIIIFIIGGVSGEETQHISDVLHKKGKNVIVGGTRLVSSPDILHLLLNQDLLMDMIC